MWLISYGLLVTGTV